MRGEQRGHAGHKHTGRDGQARGSEQQGRELPGEHGGAHQAEHGTGDRARHADQRALGDHQAAQRRLGPAERTDRGEFRRPFGDADQQRIGDGQHAQDDGRGDRDVVHAADLDRHDVAEQGADDVAAERQRDRDEQGQRGAAHGQAERAHQRAPGRAEHVHQGQPGDPGRLAGPAHVQHRRPDRGNRVGPGGQPGRDRAGHDGQRHRDRDGQGRARRGGVQPERRCQWRGQQRAEDARDQADHCHLAEHGDEQPWPGPARGRQHPQFVPAAPDRCARRVRHEQRAHDENQHEQRQAAAVYRVQDGDRDALGDPVLRQQQGGPAEPAGR